MPETAAPALDKTARLWKIAAFAEAVGWTLLLIAMVLKWVTHTTEMGVKIFGPIHGVFFMFYVVMTLKMWLEKGWSFKDAFIGLVSSIPPYMTVWFEKHADKTGLLR